MGRIIRARSMRQIAQILGETPGAEGTAPLHRVGTSDVRRIPKGRRDYTARELREMASRAAAGDAPAGSVADHAIRRAELTGDFERARALRLEVKEQAPALARLARAAEKAERRAARRLAHVHRCQYHPLVCNPHDGDYMGPCRCKCGAVQVFGYRVVAGVRGSVWWRSENGALVPWPDPRE